MERTTKTCRFFLVGLISTHTHILICLLTPPPTFKHHKKAPQKGDVQQHLRDIRYWTPGPPMVGSSGGPGREDALLKLGVARLSLSWQLVWLGWVGGERRALGWVGGGGGPWAGVGLWGEVSWPNQENNRTLLDPLQPKAGAFNQTRWGSSLRRGMLASQCCLCLQRQKCYVLRGSRKK